MTDPLRDLAQLTDALYQAELGKMQALNAREAALRHDLATLDQHLHDSRNLPENEWQGLRRIGADLLWQGWIGRNRAQLNTELAQVLAQKEARMASLRRAFGKQSAAAAMLTDAQEARKTRIEKRAVRTREEMQILTWKRDRT